VGVQTVAAPVLTALLYLLVFAHALEGRMQVYDGVGYTAFLVPGLVMMSVLQNSFANSSSSLIQSKITGNLIFVLLPPISHVEFFCAYVLAAIVARADGRLVRARSDRVVRRPAAGVAALDLRVRARREARSSARWGSSPGSGPTKFDQIAAFQNFIILPLTFLSGVFYSIHTLPPFWQGLSHLNPFFYMIDWVPLRVLWHVGFPSAGKPRGRGVKLAGAFGRGARDAEVGLQIARLIEMVTTESVKKGIENRTCVRARRGDRRRPALPGGHRVEGIRSKSRVQRHQLVYAALGERMREEIHALSMKTLTPQEWRAGG
jgi:ABC-2 type transport system permease protein